MQLERLGEALARWRVFDAPIRPGRYHRPRRAVKAGSEEHLDSGHVLANHRAAMLLLARRRSLLLAALSFGALLGSGCSSEPRPPPGGAAAAKAAAEAADRYASGLRRGIDTGKGERAMSVLRAVSSALEQYLIDASAYPEAPTCSSLAAALSLQGGRAIPQADPWGTPYDCRSWREGYTLRSAGEDGRQGTEDDIVLNGGEAW